MKMKHWICCILAILMLLAFAGCGASSNLKTESAANGSYDRAPELGYDYAVDMEYSSTQESPAENTSQASVPQGRKWIVTVDMRAETEDLDALLEQISQRIAELNGYIEDQNIYNGSNYADRRYRHANLTIRIPADQADSFTTQVGSLSNVVSHNKRLDDVTLSYVATESRMKALQAEEARLLELMGMAENMSDLLEIEARLTDVRYELENYGSRLRLYDNQVDFATIHLDIEEVQEYTPVAEPTFWERITGGFADSLGDLWESLQDLAVLIVTSAPFLVVYGGIALVVAVLVKKVRKPGRVKKDKKFKKDTKNEEEPK